MTSNPSSSALRAWLDAPLKPRHAAALQASIDHALKTRTTWIVSTLITAAMAFVAIGWPAIAWAIALSAALWCLIEGTSAIHAGLGLKPGTQGVLAYEVALSVVFNTAWTSLGLMIWILADPQIQALGFVLCLAYAVHNVMHDRGVPALAVACQIGPAVLTGVMCLEAGLVDGQWAWLLGFVGMLNVLSAAIRNQVRQSEELAEARRTTEAQLEMWELAGQASRGGRWDFDYATGHIGWSSQLDQVFGISKDTFIARGADFAALSPEPWRSEINAAFRAARDSGVRDFRLQYPILRPDGTEIWIENSVVIRRDAAGAPVHAIGFLQDVTARMAAERAAQAASDAKSAFLATMSHEIRTPLNGVIGVVGALERTELAPGQREMVELIRTSGETLERILSDILDLSRIESGRHVIEQAPFDLAAAAEAIRRLMSLRASEKGLELVARIEAAGRHLGDETALRQIITNLLSNAVKFTAQGEVRLIVEARDAGDGRDDILIEVSDTGIGFDEVTGARLFQRFVQADGTIARSYGGSGLGLSICKGLIERMGGSIEATSTPGAGSTFTVRLRLERAESDTAPTAGLTDQQGAFGEAESLRILLAEDNPTNQRVVTLLLEPTGAVITLAGNGLEALEAWRKEPFDLVLMDMMMPEMDGLVATAAIRDLERTSGRARTPIAMLTANAMPDHVRAATAAGCDGHIAKPLTPQRLFAGIEAAMARAAAASAPQDTDAA